MVEEEANTKPEEGRPGAVGSAAGLRVERLEVAYRQPDGRLAPALAPLSFSLAPGEALGIRGVSGSGKTTLALALAGLLPPHALVAASRLELAGVSLLGLSEKAWRLRRGKEIGCVFQHPFLALAPLRRAGDQLADVIEAHLPLSRRAAREKARELLEEFGLDPALAEAFPHQLSGGQRQRLVFCQAVAAGPRLLIADEPTAALDEKNVDNLLEFVARLRRRLGISLLWISHDPEVLARVADRVLEIESAEAEGRGLDSRFRGNDGGGGGSDGGVDRASRRGSAYSGSEPEGRGLDSRFRGNDGGGGGSDAGVDCASRPASAYSGAEPEGRGLDSRFRGNDGGGGGNDGGGGGSDGGADRASRRASVYSGAEPEGRGLDSRFRGNDGGGGGSDGGVDRASRPASAYTGAEAGSFLTGEPEGGTPSQWVHPLSAAERGQGERSPLLVATSLTVELGRGRFFERRRKIVLLDGVDFALDEGEVVGLLGASGSGKTTLLRCLSGLLSPTRGRVEIGGEDLFSSGALRLRQLRRRVQMVGQDPSRWVDPLWPLWRIVSEGEASRPDAPERDPARLRASAAAALARVGLEDDLLLDRVPAELSGGQLQRAVLARALCRGEARVLLLDEAFSALDPPRRAQLLDLLLSLRRGAGLALVVVSHQRRWLESFCSRLLHMDERGRLRDA